MTFVTVMRLWFLFTQLGIMVAMFCGVIVMIKINQKLDRDHVDRDLLRAFLVEQSNRALAAAEAVNPTTARDRRYDA